MAAGQQFEVKVPASLKDGLQLNNGQTMPMLGLGYVALRY
jgi:hypothetical protein